MPMLCNWCVVCKIRFGNGFRNSCVMASQTTTKCVLEMGFIIERFTEKAYIQTCQIFMM